MFITFVALKSAITETDMQILKVSKLLTPEWIKSAVSQGVPLEGRCTGSTLAEAMGLIADCMRTKDKDIHLDYQYLAKFIEADNVALAAHHIIEEIGLKHVKVTVCGHVVTARYSITQSVVIIEGVPYVKI